MCLVFKTCTRVKFFSLWEQRSDGGVRQAFGVQFLYSSQNAIEQVIHNGAVQKPLNFISIAIHSGIHVFRDRSPLLFKHSYELFMCEFYCLNSGLGSKIKTIAGFDHCTNNRGAGEAPTVFFSPLICTEYVIFPKVAPCAKPVIVLCTGLKLRTAQKFQGGFEITTVICKD